MSSKRPIKYHMECGCILDNTQLTRTTSRTERFLSCKIHKRSRIKYRSTTCLKCEKWFEFPAKGNYSLYCPSCQQEKPTYRRKGRPVKFNADAVKITEQVQASMDRVDCIYRNNCLERVIPFKEITCLPCLRCTYYSTETENKKSKTLIPLIKH